MVVNKVLERMPQASWCRQHPRYVEITRIWIGLQDKLFSAFENGFSKAKTRRMAGTVCKSRGMMQKCGKRREKCLQKADTEMIL